MAAPRLVFDETRRLWRVEYAGMLREHSQYWQALVWYEDALQSYGIEGGAETTCGLPLFDA
jgi:hypothetical protein